VSPEQWPARPAAKTTSVFRLPGVGSSTVLKTQVVQCSPNGLEVRELGEISSPLYEVSLPQLDELLAQHGIDPLQLLLSGVYRSQCSAYPRAIPLLQVTLRMPLQRIGDSAEEIPPALFESGPVSFVHVRDTLMVV